MPTLAIYCRTSKAKSIKVDQSIPNQRESGIKFAKSIGWNHEIFIDAGISGASDVIESRPEFARMIESIDNGNIQGIYCFDQSRIERSNLVWAFFTSLVIKKKCKLFVGGVEYNLQNPNTTFTSGIMSLSNQHYAATISRKAKIANERKTRQGKTHGKLPYGYKRSKEGTFAIDEEEAKVVRRIFKESSEGKGTYTIANGLNEDGVKTRSANKYEGHTKIKEPYTGKTYEYPKTNIKWRGNTVHGIITNPIHKGVRVWNKEDEERRLEVQIDECIIEPDFWEAVNENLKANAKNVGRRESYNYLLNGLINCHHCSHDFYGKKRLKGNDNSYKCKGARKTNRICFKSRGISLPKLENFIIQHLFRSKDLKLLLMKAPKKSNESEKLQNSINELNDDFSRINTSKRKLLDFLKDPELNDDDVILADFKNLKDQESKIQQQIKQLESRLAQIMQASNPQRTKNTIESYTEGIEFDKIKTLVHSLVESIELIHEPSGKEVKFHVQLKYRGRNEYSLFATDYKALQWHWLSFFRTEANTSKELKKDREEEIELFSYLLKDDGLDANDAKMARSCHMKNLSSKGQQVDRAFINRLNGQDPFNQHHAGRYVFRDGILPPVILSPSEFIHFD